MIFILINTFFLHIPLPFSVDCCKVLLLLKCPVIFRTRSSNGGKGSWSADWPKPCWRYPWGKEALWMSQGLRAWCCKDPRWWYLVIALVYFKSCGSQSDECQVLWQHLGDAESFCTWWCMEAFDTATGLIWLVQEPLRWLVWWPGKSEGVGLGCPQCSDEAWCEAKNTEEEAIIITQEQCQPEDQEGSNRQESWQVTSSLKENVIWQKVMWLLMWWQKIMWLLMWQKTMWLLMWCFSRLGSNVTCAVHLLNIQWFNQQWPACILVAIEQKRKHLHVQLAARLKHIILTWHAWFVFSFHFFKKKSKTAIELPVSLSKFHGSMLNDNHVFKSINKNITRWSSRVCP